MAFGKRRTYLMKLNTVVWQMAKFGSSKVGETERGIFCPVLCVSNFSLCAESLVNSTPPGNFRQSLFLYFCRRQFHQHFFTSAFFMKVYWAAFLCLEFVFKRTFFRKMCAENVDEIDSRNTFSFNLHSRFTFLLIF